MEGSWARDQKRLCPFDVELLLENEKRQIAEMVGVKMADQNGLDRRAVEPKKAGIETSAGAEGISRSDEFQCNAKTLVFDGFPVSA